MNYTNPNIEWYSNISLTDTANLSWFGQNFIHYRGPISQIKKLIPYFDRQSFAIDEGINKYHDVIIRKP